MNSGKTDLTEALNKDLKIQKTNVLVNLASNEYFSVLDKEMIRAESNISSFQGL